MYKGLPQLLMPLKSEHNIVLWWPVSCAKEIIAPVQSALPC